MELLQLRRDRNSDVDHVALVTVCQDDIHAFAKLSFELSVVRSEPNRHETDADESRGIEFRGKFQLIDIRRANNFEWCVGASANRQLCRLQEADSGIQY